MGDLSQNFSRYEFACPCGCGADDVSPELVSALQGIRALAGVPIIVHSAVRCEKYNKSVGGKPDSQHLTGKAADISARGIKIFDLLLLTQDIDVFYNGGIGIYDQHIHVDVRGHMARWTLQSKQIKTTQY
jgi:zinc D-Ala-D-Ala carboxypeptidase